MPQVKNPQIQAGWYTNRAVDDKGQPRALSLGTVSFRPGQRKHVPAHLLAESRSTHDAFVRAVAGGKLVADAAGEKPVVVAEKPVVVVAEKPVVAETVVVEQPVTDDFKASEVITAETPAPQAEGESRAKKRRRVE